MVNIDNDRTAFENGDLFLQHFLPGDSKNMRDLRGSIYRLNIAHKNKNMIPSILLTGERGVGKSFTAHVLAAHMGWLRTSKGEDLSPSESDDVYKIADRAGIRKVALTAVPEALCEVTLFGAKKGAYTDLRDDRIGLFDTKEAIDIFLDEIGDATPGIQAKLLDVLETKQFRPLGAGFDENSRVTAARIIFATNRDLQSMVDNRQFRADLHDRLLWSELSLPPLRDQLDQLPLLIERMTKVICRKYNINSYRQPSARDIEFCQNYNWPGNHRELSQILWKWYLYEYTVPLESIIRDRSRSRRSVYKFETTITENLFSRFDAILSGISPGFGKYGQVVEEMRRLAYTALYRFNQKRELKDDELKLLFSAQKPSNVRKQISANRPKQQNQEEL